MIRVSDSLSVELPKANRPGEVEAINGMSESLANGLVRRFTSEWKAVDRTALATTVGPMRMKRAARFRQQRDWIKQTVPDSLRIIAFSSGQDERGKSKDASYMVVHWVPDEQGESLAVTATSVQARGNKHWSVKLLRVSRHALVRLFQRLKTDDEDVVLKEASLGVVRYYLNLTRNRDVIEEATVLVPTPHGTFVAEKDMLRNDVRVVFKTWISDARLAESEARLTAVKKARAASSIVVMVDGRHVVLGGGAEHTRPAAGERRPLDQSVESDGWLVSA